MEPTAPIDTDRPPDVVRRAFGDAVWNAAALALPGVANVIILAYLLRTFGPAGFAPWATALALLGLLTVLDAGLGATTARNAARAIAGDPEATALVRAAYVAYAGLAVLVLLLGVAMSPLIARVLDLDGVAASDATVVAVILAVDLAIVVGSTGWLGTLRGARRFDLTFLASAAQVAVGVPATLVLVPQFGLAGAAVAQVLGRAFGRSIAAVAVHRAVPQFPVLVASAPAGSLRRVGIFALPILAMGIAIQLGIGVDPIIVGATAGATAVGLYAAGSGLVRYVGQLLLPVIGVLLPSFTEIAFSQPDSIQPLLLRCVRLAAGFGTIVFGTLAVSATAVMQLWIGRVDELSVQTLILYSIAFACWTPSQVLILMLIASGRHGFLGLALLVDALLNIALSIWLAVLIGPVGVALSSLVTLAAVHLVVIPAVAVDRLKLSAQGLVQALVVGGGLGAVVVVAITLIPADNLTGLLICGLVAVVACAALLYVDQAREAERSALDAELRAVPHLDFSAAQDVEPAQRECGVHDGE